MNTNPEMNMIPGAGGSNPGKQIEIDFEERNRTAAEFKIVNPETISKLEKGTDGVWRLGGLNAKEYNDLFNENDNSNMYKHNG